jgi:hypothetical protein
MKSTTTAAVIFLGACGAGTSGTPLPPDPVPSTIIVTKTGDGTGRVSTTPAAVDCRETCPNQQGETVVGTTSVVLRAQPARDTVLRRIACSVGSEAPLVVEQANANTGEGAELTLAVGDDDDSVQWTCTVDFVRVYSITVIPSGSGEGVVRGALLDGNDVSRLDCGGGSDDCLGAYVLNEVETLTATPGPTSVFTRWRNCGEGTAPLVFTVNTDISCVAQFDALPPE